MKAAFYNDISLKQRREAPFPPLFYGHDMAPTKNTPPKLWSPFR